MRLPLGTGVGEFAQVRFNVNLYGVNDKMTTGGNSSRVSLIYMVSLLLAV